MTGDRTMASSVQSQCSLAVKDLEPSTKTTVAGGKEETEVYIRADGKKVRRIKKTVVRTVSASSSAAPGAAAPGAAATTESSLHNFLGMAATKRPKVSGSATVAGSTPAKSKTIAEGEIYIRPDGKKVRRVKRNVSTSAHSAAGDLASSASTSTPAVKKSGLAGLFSSNKAPVRKNSGAATVAGHDRADSEIIIRPDGTKVRRVRKTVARSSSSVDDSSIVQPAKVKTSLADLGSGRPTRKSGAASVSGISSSKSVAEGEIYINKDGKKVRRVKKNSSASVAGKPDAASLGGFLGHSSGVKKLSGSATVAGDTPAKPKTFSEGEIYIRADGKKVRRVKKDGSMSLAGANNKAMTRSSSFTESNTPSTSLASLVVANGSGAGSNKTTTAMSASSPSGTASGASSAQPSSSAAASVQGEVYINKDGKKVRRVPKTQASTDSLGGFLGLAGSKTKKASGSATVAGETPTKSKTFSEGEVYIRPDGKKVRRVRKDGGGGASVVASSTAGDLAGADTKESLTGFLNNNSAAAKAKRSGSATVAGDRVAPTTTTTVAASTASTEGAGEIVIRADGKKVIRRKKTAGASNTSQDTEVYRRADGKLVRRVKRSSSTTASTQPKKNNAAGDLAGFLDTTSDGKTNSLLKTSGSATVAGTSTGITGPPPAVTQRLKTNTTDVTTTEAAPLSSSSPEATSASSRTNDPRALVPEEQSGAQNENKPAVAQEPFVPISQAPLQGEEPSTGSLSARTHSIASASTPPNAAVSSLRLTASEEEIAGTYCKMMKMGLPSDAVRHKMEQDGVEPKIIVAVLGSDPRNGSSSDRPHAISSASAEANVEVTVSPVRLAVSEEEIAEAYRKMMKMGLPSDAVRHKMEQDGVEPKIIAAVLGDTRSDSAPAQTSPPPVAALAPAPQSSEPVSSSVKLTDSKEDTAATYRKMATMVRPTPPPMTTTPAAQPSNTEPAGASVPLSDSDEETVGTYRKMMKLGLSSDAVRHKMEQDGVEPRIIAAVLGESDSAPAPTSPTPVAAPAPALPGSEPAVSRVELTDSEEETAVTYRKMMKMGLPTDAIHHKLQQDGVESKINDSSPPRTAPPTTPAVPPTNTVPVSSSVRLTDSEEETAGVYRKMMKMGLPSDAVRHKMQQDGVEPKIIATILGDPWSESSLAWSTSPSTDSAQMPPAAEPSASSIQLTSSEEETAGTYRKMMKMGLPSDAVRHKMQQDGVESKIIAAVLGDPWSDSSPAPPTPPTMPAARPSTTQPVRSSVQLTDSEEERAGTYRKMMNMGLPSDAVRHKMEQDGVEPKIIAAVLGDTSHSVGESAAPSAADQSTPQEGAERRVSYNLVVSEDKPKTEAKAPPSLGSALSALPRLKRSDSFETVSPTEKFAVNLESGPAAGPGSKNDEETKYMTLDDIARLSGQSRSDLEKMIVARRQNAEQIPRFVLQSLNADDDAMSLYPVQIAKSQSKHRPNPVDTNPALANADPSKLKEIKDGEEVVDTALANAARAMSALGEGDMSALFAKLQGGDMGDLMKKLQEAEKRQKKLEKQLAQAGVAIAEDIDYGEAKAKVGEIAKRMNEIGGSDIVVSDKNEQNRLREEYFKLEQEMERYNTALMISEEYQAEQDAMEKKWEADNLEANMEALKKLRRHMPVKIRHMSEAELTNTPSPNGKFLPQAIAKKFKRTNILQCLRLSPDDIERMHPSTLESMRVTGLTLTERRALYTHLKPIGPKWERNKAEKMTERKWTWYKMMKSNFKENLAPYDRHVAQYGPPGNHPYATRDNPNSGCPLLGKLCPLKADKVIDYDNDYGWTDKDEYEVSQVTKADCDEPGAKAKSEALELAREKKSNERADLLKKHYKGKLLQVSKANGSCEAMDESMDKAEFATARWIEFSIEKGANISDADKNKEVANFTEALNELKLAVLDFCQRSGIQTSGRRKEGGSSPDIRSSVECGLSEELYECTQELFKYIRDRMKVMGKRDTRVEKTLELLEKMMGELHGRNVAALEKLGMKRPDRSRRLKKNEDIRREVEEKLKPKEEGAAEEEEAGPGPLGQPHGGGGERGNLLGAISGRGRGGGRGDLLGAIAGRSKGRGGGRGDLLGAIAGRGGGRGDAGGRGGLMAAIAARGAGKGPGGGGDGGGRGGLLAAIAARGGGG